MSTMGNIFKPNPELIGHHPRGQKVFLGENQIFINEKFKKFDFLDGESKYFSTFSTR